MLIALLLLHHNHRNQHEDIMHKKPGYILFLLFSILSVCSILISLYFSRVVIYRQLMQQLTRQQQTTTMNMSSIALAQTLIIPKQEEEKEEQSPKQPQPKQSDQIDAKLLTNLFAYFNKEKIHELTTATDGIQATLTLSIQSEQGKLNINSLYDLEKKKFVNEGQQQNDKKKLCVWLFNQIATITGKPNLLQPFEQYMKNRTYDLNDVTELLAIKEFSQQFCDNLFFNPTDTKTKKLFLTDIFTVCSEQETITPLLLSPSWCILLGLQPKQTMSPEELQKFFTSLKIENNWTTDWNGSLQGFYQKDYKDLAEEIKSILTTRYEANIFSLLLKTKIGETNSTIFTIVKTNTKQHLLGFDIIKTYQI